jgi:hypothetical protein
VNRYGIKNLLLAGFATLVLLLTSCSNDKKNHSKRPSSVPETASFFGGYDGWIWINCRNEAFDKLICQIYEKTGALERTVFLKPCLNVLPKYSQARRKLSGMEDNVFFFDNVSFYEYKPAVYSDSSPNGRELAEKYYRALGVHTDCSPIGGELKKY